MFTLSRKQVLISIALSMLSTYASPQHAEIEARGAYKGSVTGDICTGDPGTGCTDIPVDSLSGSCVNLNGGFVFFDKEISSAIIPCGIVCTFFENFGCLSKPGAADAVVLTTGTWNFSHVPGTGQAAVDFNDLTSSLNYSLVLPPSYY